MSIDGHLSYSYHLAVVNSAAMNICIQVFEYLFSVLGGIHPGVELLGHTYLCCLVTHSCLTLCDPMDCSPPVSTVHGNHQARILECCHFLLQGIFPAQGLNPHLLQWQVGSLPLNCQGSPSRYLLDYIAYNQMYSM